MFPFSSVNSLAKRWPTGRRLVHNAEIHYRRVALREARSDLSAAPRNLAGANHDQVFEFLSRVTARLDLPGNEWVHPGTPASCIGTTPCGAPVRSWNGASLRVPSPGCQVTPTRAAASPRDEAASRLLHASAAAPRKRQTRRPDRAPVPLAT
jgi:hypothetical protein